MDAVPDAPIKRLTRFYAWLGVFAVVGLTSAFVIGSDKSPQTDYSGRYAVDASAGCLGRTFDLRQSGQFAALETVGGAANGSLRVDDGAITGTIECVDGSEDEADLRARTGRIDGTIGRKTLVASRVADAPPPEEQSSVRPPDLGGTYELTPSSPCLGTSIDLTGGETRVGLSGAGRVEGSAKYSNGRLMGTATCVNGSHAILSGEAADRSIELELTPPPDARPQIEPERVSATETRDLNDQVAVFLVALIAIVVAARLLGEVAVYLRQPRVMGEVVAGIALGPTILGAIAPETSAALFPSDMIGTLGVAANLGVILYMFMIGAEVDLSQLRHRIGTAVAVSNGSLAVPLVLGVAVAVPVYGLVAPDVGFVEFALFMGVAMSITAFPVLARILAERNMLARPIGATALAAAAIDDVSAWFLIALGTAFATSGSGSEVLTTIGLAIVYCVVMFGAVRPLLARTLGTRSEEGGISSGWLATVLAAVLLSAYATELIGIAVIFGAFIMGLVMPRNSRLTDDARTRIEDVVVLLLLPLFFAYTGLRTDVGLLDDPDLWLLAGGLLVVAIVGKFAGAMIAARVSGMTWRRSAILGTLMNTRGLTELIALNLALDLGVISEALFTCLVLMALVTTFMAGPLLNLLDREVPQPVADAATPPPQAGPA